MLDPDPQPCLLQLHKPPLHNKGMVYFAVLWMRIQDVYRGSRIRLIGLKEFKYFNPKNCFSALGNMIRVSSRICIPDPDPDFLPIPDTGSRGQKGTGSQIRIRNIGILVPVAWSKIACADLRVDLLHDLAEVSGGERLDVVSSAVAEIFLVHLMLGQGNLSQGPGCHIFSSSLPTVFFKVASFYTCWPPATQVLRIPWHFGTDQDTRIHISD